MDTLAQYHPTHSSSWKSSNGVSTWLRNPTRAHKHSQVLCPNCSALGISLGHSLSYLQKGYLCDKSWESSPAANYYPTLPKIPSLGFCPLGLTNKHKWPHSTGSNNFTHPLFSVEVLDQREGRGVLMQVGGVWGYSGPIQMVRFSGSQRTSLKIFQRHTGLGTAFCNFIRLRVPLCEGGGAPWVSKMVAKRIGDKGKVGKVCFSPFISNASP